MPFYFRINRIKVIDNRESGFLFFSKDRAEIKLTSMVVTGDSDFPQIDTYKKEIAICDCRNPRAERKLAASLVAQVVSRRKLITIGSVKDNQTITFGDTGYVVYRSDTIPQELNWCLLAMEDDSDIRNFGATMQDVVGSDGFDSFAAGIATLVGTTANPAIVAGMAIVKFVARVVAQSLKKNGDDMTGLLYMSLNRQEHYPHGERKSDGVPDLTGNMIVDYSLFGFQDVPNPVVPV